MTCTCEENAQDLSNEDYECIPDWATGIAKGTYIVGAQLQTRDGRRTGNAYLSDWIPSKYCNDIIAVCITDAGNIILANRSEIQELFHPPQYTMRPLPSHIAALRKENES